MKIFIVAGEASGDVLGAQVLQGLKARFGEDLEIAGLGGPQMMAQGLKPPFPMSDMAVMGFVEVLMRYPLLRRRIQELKTAIEAFQPDILFLIDAQGLSSRLGKHFADATFRIVQLVAPTVWAWKPERAAKVAAYLDHLACLFPFEPPYFEAEGLSASYVGHPALALKGGMSKPEARAKLDLPMEETWAAVLPGSRGPEIKQLGPGFARSVQEASRQGILQGVLIPVASTVRDEVTAWAATLPLSVKLLETEEEQAWLSAADCALAASGTVSLELSAKGVPSLLAYKFQYLSYLYVRGKLTTDFIGLTNLLLGQEVQREFKLNYQPEADMIEAFCTLAASKEEQDRVRELQFRALDQLEIEDGLDFGSRVAALL